MTRVRLEVEEDRPVEGAFNTEEVWTFTVEVEGPETGSALSRATRAMKEALAEPQPRGMPETVIHLNNVRFTDAVQDTLFGRVVGTPAFEPERCGDRVFWLGAGYGCERYEGHPDHHESTLGLKWHDGGALMFCGGKWEQGPFSELACRLPLDHEGDCGPLPEDTERERCPSYCPIDEAGHPPDQCARLQGHSGPHQSETAGCEWSDPPCGESPTSSSSLRCDLPQGHAGPHQKHFDQGGTEWG